MEDSVESIVAIGGSVRACVESIGRAGYRARGYDRFADRHAASGSSIVCIDSKLPEAWYNVIRANRSCKVITTGPLENTPDIISLIDHLCDNLGSPAHTLSKLRDPCWLQHLLREASLQSLNVTKNRTECDLTRQWLRKPLRSSAGNGICFTTEHDTDTSQSYYYQEYIDRIAKSALFITTQHATHCVGCCLILTDSDELSGTCFRYCGNIGPIDLSLELETWLNRIGNMLAENSPVRGIWGIDFIEQNGQFYLLEVNPRYTSSVEIYEQAMERSLMYEMLTNQVAPTVMNYPVLAGKFIYYSTVKQYISTVVLNRILESSTDCIRYVDVPSHDDDYQPGSPIMTILVYGCSIQDCLDKICIEKIRLDRYLSHPIGTTS